MGYKYNPFTGNLDKVVTNLDDTYLRLDAANDPVTGHLRLTNPSSAMSFGTSGSQEEINFDWSQGHYYVGMISQAGTATVDFNGGSNIFRFTNYYIMSPGTDDVMDIGTSSVRFQDLYLSKNLSDGTNELTIANAKTAYDHSVLTSGNPHVVTYAELGTIDISTNTNLTASNGVELTDDNLTAVPGEIDHGGLAGLSDNDHTQYILHSLADAENDFLIASGADTFVKKTLAEVGAILETDIDHGNLQGLSTGADHSYIDQDVTSGSTPTFGGANITGVASSIIADESSDTTCYPLFVTAATGTLPLKTGTNLTFNSATGALKTTGTFEADGHVGFGNNSPPSDSIVINVTENNSLASSNFYGILGLPILTTNSNTTSVGAALQFPLVLLGSGDLTNDATGQWGTDTGLTNYMTGTIAREGGIRSALTILNGTHTHISGVTIKNDLGGTITTYKGLEIRTNTGATTPTNYYGIYQEDADMINYFAGEIQAEKTVYANATGTSLEMLGDIKIKADSKKLYFGAGDDCYIESDGTDLILEPSSGEIKANGDMNVSGEMKGSRLMLCFGEPFSRTLTTNSYFKVAGYVTTNNGGSVNKGYVMSRPGSIISLGTFHEWSSHTTNGTIKEMIKIDGVEVTPLTISTVHTGTDWDNNSYVTVARDTALCTFSAGDVIQFYQDKNGASGTYRYGIATVEIVFDT